MLFDLMCEIVALATVEFVLCINVHVVFVILDSDVEMQVVKSMYPHNACCTSCGVHSHLFRVVYVNINNNKNNKKSFTRVTVILLL